MLQNLGRIVLRAIIRFRCAMIVCCCAVAFAEPLTVGVAEIDITPPVGNRMSGYFHERLSTAVHDPLHARAIAFQQGEERGAIVVCELVGVPVDATQPARRRAADQTGIPVENILVSATHTHTGADYFGARFAYCKELAIAEHGTDPHEEVPYIDTLTDAIVAAIEQAESARVPVAIRAGVATQEGLAFNRRFHMKEGPVRFNPGKQNPDIVRPAGPTDPAVPMIVFESLDQERPDALLTAFALHLDTVGGTEYAADYPYYMASVIREEHADLIPIFAIGTAGDINHIDVSTKTPQKGHEEAKRIGDALGATMAEALDELPSVKEPSFAAQTESVALPLQQYSEEEVAYALANRAKIVDDSVPFLERVRLYKIIDSEMRGEDAIAVDVQAFRLGPDVAIVGLPGEIFVDLGLAIKEASPFQTTLIITLANDYCGYVPTRKAFEEGSYETVNSRVQPGGGEKLVEAAVRMLIRLAE
ncbi:MAG: hypothetical protein AMXMBFR82_27640 [Candidatus Hydrogenedentota bacterium]